MRSEKLQFEVEIGGQTLRLSGTGYPGDPGQTSGPPEYCYPPEPAYFEAELTELFIEVQGNKARLDITDLVCELGGEEIVQDAADRAFENYEPEDYEPD